MRCTGFANGPGAKARHRRQAVLTERARPHPITAATMTRYEAHSPGRFFDQGQGGGPSVLRLGASPGGGPGGGYDRQSEVLSGGDRRRRTQVFRNTKKNSNNWVEFDHG